MPRDPTKYPLKFDMDCTTCGGKGTVPDARNVCGDGRTWCNSHCGAADDEDCTGQRPWPIDPLEERS